MKSKDGTIVAVNVETGPDGMTWVDFWAAVESPCSCSDPECGLIMRRCPDCGRAQLAVRILAQRPVIQVICLSCHVQVEAFKVQRGGQ